MGDRNTMLTEGEEIVVSIDEFAIAFGAFHIRHLHGKRIAFHVDPFGDDHVLIAHVGSAGDA